jgi:hypothetical protein
MNVTPSHSSNATLDAPPQATTLPFVVNCEQAAEGQGHTFLNTWLTERDRLDDAMHRHGAVLFRGFNISTVGTFQGVAANLKSGLLEYVDGNSPRKKVGGGVYTSTEYPPEYFISLHNELSYSATWPRRLFFCCVIEPQERGETPLVDSRVLLRVLPKEISKTFRAKRVKYIRNLHGGRGFGPSWQTVFQTEDRVEAEAFATKSGMDAEWLPDGVLRLTSVRPAIAEHPLTGEEVWFNQADQFHPSTHPPSIYKSMLALYKGREDLLPQNAQFGDGTAIPVEWLDTIRETTRQNIQTFPWRQGDLLMVDNMLAAHGRMPFKGPRKILVAMTAH